ncbi:MAG: EAL domain-containing protein [Candidatus Binataceae bacterium]|nr:EAL domain-containing protein [Candidatus Binataceae bacterium]
MDSRRVFRVAKPYVAAVAVITLMVFLVATILLTQLNLEWMIFLTGVLTASILALTSRATRAEWSSLRKTARLSALQEKHKQELRLRERAEATLAKILPRLKFVDELLPVMLACVDLDTRFQYHNLAFREWVGLKADQINGQTMKDVLGRKIFGDLAPVLQSVLAGSVVSQQRTRTMRNGTVYRLLEQYVPYRGNNGELAGFYMLNRDITERSDLAGQVTAAAAGSSAGATPDARGTERDVYVDSSPEEIAGSKDAARQMVAAIERNDFKLFCQRIEPLAAERPGARHHEVLIRLVDEEENTSSPGAFFPLVEKYGLMPKLDRWVVEQAVKWASFRAPTGEQPEQSMLFINLASATIAEPDFPGFVGHLLKEHRLDAGALCFEIFTPDATHHHDQIVLLADRLRTYGCRIALSGFGRDQASFELLKDIKVDFLKIDGSLVLRIHRDPLDMARLKSVHRVARIIGVKTVAELVEDQATITVLRKLGVDYAQGFGISQPGPLSEIA